MALLAGDDLALDKLTPQEFDARLAARSVALKILPATSAGGVNFADSRLETTSVLEVDAARGDLVLAAAGADAVIAARSSAQGRTVACGFRPDETTWVLQASFAVFVNNAIDWLAASP